MRISSSHRPGDCVVASLDDDLRPPADPSHPSEKAVRVDQLEAIHQVVGPTHPGPQLAVRVVLYIAVWHLGQRKKVNISSDSNQVGRNKGCTINCNMDKCDNQKPGSTTFGD